MSVPDLTLDNNLDYKFSYEKGCDIWIPDEASPEGGYWQPIRWGTNWSFPRDSVTQNAQTDEDKGAPNDIAVAQTWTGSGHVQLRFLADGSVLPEVKQLRKLAEAIGATAIGQIRSYDKPSARKPDPDDAFSGRCTVKLEPDNTGPAGEISGYNITFTGIGAPVKIANPAPDPTTTTP